MGFDLAVLFVVLSSDFVTFVSTMSSCASPTGGELWESVEDNSTTTSKAHECGEASNKLCSGNGHCALFPGQSKYTCHCCPGFRGSTCKIEVTGDACSTKTCLNGGTCHNLYQMDNKTDPDVHTDWQCACPVYVTGSKCEVILNQCKSNPCINGICKETALGYQCYCVPGFNGSQCEEEYNECLSNPCQNRGRCVDRVDNFECRCFSGYMGQFCETQINSCIPNPCLTEATCIMNGTMVQCLSKMETTQSGISFSENKFMEGPHYAVYVFVCLVFLVGVAVPLILLTRNSNFLSKFAKSLLKRVLQPSPHPPKSEGPNNCISKPIDKQTPFDVENKLS